MNRSVDKPGHPLVEEVLSYLLQHPGAQDTVEGIAEWWLLEERIRHSVSAVRTALAEVMAQNLVIARRGADGRVHYRANPQKEQEIRERLKMKPATPSAGTG